MEDGFAAEPAADLTDLLLVGAPTSSLPHNRFNELAEPTERESFSLDEEDAAAVCVEGSDTSTKRKRNTDQYQINRQKNQ